VIGSGYWGINLVRNFNELGVLELVCDQSVSSLDKTREISPSIKTTTDYKKILDNKNINGVVIATPAITHFDLAMEFLKSGKDVFVEKPLSLNLKDAAKLIKYANQNKRILMVGHVLEYHPAIVEIQKIISSGVVGDLQYLYSNRLNFGRIRKEENILWSFAPHDIAIILRIIGKTPLTVSATGAEYLTPSVSDVTLTALSFENQIRAHIHVSWLHPFKEQRLVVIGSKKMLTFDDVSKKLRIYDQWVEIQNTNLTPISGNVSDIAYDNTEPLKIECEAFIESIATRKNPLTDGESGLKVLQI
ncbi:uncharacterized protein METZ01_LOCUS295391, partial [marine metagenome]